MSSPWIAPFALALSLAAPAQNPQPMATAAAATSEQAPHAVFEKVELDAGDVTRGQDLPFTFTVKNTGAGVLKILSAKPG